MIFVEITLFAFIFEWLLYWFICKSCFLNFEFGVFSHAYLPGYRSKHVLHHNSKSLEFFPVARAPIVLWNFFVLLLWDLKNGETRRSHDNVIGLCELHHLHSHCPRCRSKQMDLGSENWRIFRAVAYVCWICYPFLFAKQICYQGLIWFWQNFRETWCTRRYLWYNIHNGVLQRDKW